MRLNKKRKDNSGSALILAILGIALVSICTISISFQINNQIRSNNNLYEDMKYKYMAEAGIERAIYDIEKDIKNKVKYIIDDDALYNNFYRNSHNSCPKVEFVDGKPQIGNYATPGNTFAYLIYHDMIFEKANNLHNELLGSNMVAILGSDHPLIKGDVAWIYYRDDIREYINLICSGHKVYNHAEMENKISGFENMMNMLINDISSSDKGKEEDRVKFIGIATQMKEYMIEIKCRLGMLDSEPPIEMEISIVVPEYNVSIINDEELKFDKIVKNVYIDVKRDDKGVLQSISFEKLNNTKIVSTSEDKKIEAKIDFKLEKLNNGYDIKREIQSYEQK